MAPVAALHRSCCVVQLLGHYEHPSITVALLYVEEDEEEMQVLPGPGAAESDSICCSLNFASVTSHTFSSRTSPSQNSSLVDPNWYRRAGTPKPVVRSPILTAMILHLTTHMVCMLPSLASHTSRYNHDYRTPYVGQSSQAFPKPFDCFRLRSTQKQAQHQLHASPFCSLTRSVSNCRSFRRKQRVVKAGMQLDNRELLVGDCLSLVSFCLYKQVNNRMQSSGHVSISQQTTIRIT